MNYRTLTSIALLLCMATTSFSKPGFKIGISGGYCLDKIKEKNYSDREKRMSAFDVAIPMEIKISDYFAIQPEVHFIQKGFGIDMYGIGGVETQYKRRIYAEVHILFKGIFDFKEKSSINFYTGIGVGVAITNKIVQKNTDGSKTKENYPYDNNVDDDNQAYRRYDIVIPIGFGYEYRIADRLSFFTDIRYNMDVNNNIRYKVKPSPTPKYKYRNFILSVGFNFIAKER